jgi:DNA mismatch repair protein MutS2
MPFSSQSLLQFEELKVLVASYAGSETGAELLLELEPGGNRFGVEADLADAGEAITYVREATNPLASRGAAVRLRFNQLHDVRPSLSILRVDGARLDGRALMELFQVLEIAGEYRTILVGVRERFPRLARRADALTDLRGFVRRFAKAFLPDGSLSDEASVALGRIRREMERQQKTIQQSLERFLRAHRSDGTVQEDFVTIRDDRFVVPIVAGQKGRVDGVIHGSSGSGRTLFVEPLETIQLNNQLVRLREDELREVERILSEITENLREHRDEVIASAQTLAHLDFLFAKAAFATEYEAVIPKFSPDSDRRLVLQNARHPLLESVLRKQRRPIIPISFELDEQQRCLLISGPNTGGKTVTMKTTGLLALMAHAGLPVPVTEAVFPFFDDVLADIGDSQSIQESLSSFSGHLIHVKQMMEAVTPNSLVLMDELGRATDPEEGGALGVAILDRFRQTGAFCLASTHLLPLKLYGTKTAGVVNASMGFDDATLQPTYQLRVGLPGKSAGLDIASRLELPSDVIAHARSVLPKLEADFQSLLVELHRQIEEHAEQQLQLARATADLEQQKATVEREAVQREERRRQQWLRQTEELVARFDEQARTTIDKVVHAGDQRKAAEQASRLIAKAKREFREEASEALQPPAGQPAPPPLPVLKEGARVRLKDVREPATVRRILKNGFLEVEAGFMKMQISTEDIAEVLSGSAPASLPKNVSLQSGPSWDVSYRELNLIGQRAEEALEHVDKFLDSAAMASVNRVRIIHGHGMGVLKKAVAEFLQKSPHVATFYAATQAEGGSGATIVELRE